MPKPRKKPAPPARPKKRSVPDKVAELSIASGDPLQPAGLSEYLMAEKGRAATGPAPSAGADARRTERGAALKAAQARWSNKHRPVKK
jgi:hypothetical protein